MTKIDFDLKRSLQELQGEDWGEPTYDSFLVTECHRLHRVPLKDLFVEDICRMIGQQIGLAYLVPMALRELNEHPYSDAELYEGALLNAVLNVEAAFWEKRSDLAKSLIGLINSLACQLVQMRSYERNGVLKVLAKGGPLFLARCGVPGATLVDHGKPNKDQPLTDDESVALTETLLRPMKRKPCSH